MTLQFICAEIERLHLQIRRLRKEVFTLQRSDISSASAELLLARMQASVDALCITRDKLVVRKIGQQVAHDLSRQLIEHVGMFIVGNIREVDQAADNIIFGKMIFRRSLQRRFREGAISRLNLRSMLLIERDCDTTVFAPNYGAPASSELGRDRQQKLVWNLFS
jgi:hypothetical protein